MSPDEILSRAAAILRNTPGLADEFFDAVFGEDYCLERAGQALEEDPDRVWPIMTRHATLIDLPFELSEYGGPVSGPQVLPAPPTLKGYVSLPGGASEGTGAITLATTEQPDYPGYVFGDVSFGGLGSGETWTNQLLSFENAGGLPYLTIWQNQEDQSHNLFFLPRSHGGGFTLSPLSTGEQFEFAYGEQPDILDMPQSHQHPSLGPDMVEYEE